MQTSGLSIINSAQGESTGSAMA